MGHAVGDPVNVQVDGAGRPIAFAWRGKCHQVSRVMEHWVATRDWWRAQDPSSDDLGEREFWRVEAALDDEIGVYELRLDVIGGAWTLSRAWG